MANETSYHGIIDRLAALHQTMAERLGPDLAGNPHLADVINQRLEQMESSINQAEGTAPKPADGGLGALAGLGPEAAGHFGETRMPLGVEPYDDKVSSERIVATGDLYYIYQHERIGVFRVVQKLKELFNAGAVRLSKGDGAFNLYQFDRREVLRYTGRERLAAYRRAFGYGSAQPAPGARTNAEFHGLFANFMNQVALFWRDKRISDVVRNGAYDPSFGSIAIVRRSGLDLRNNLKFSSYGHVNVMRVELMQLLEDAFKILNAADVKNLFGVDTGWDVIEEVLSRYYNERLDISPRQRMAVTGRDVLHWLAHGHILREQRTQFETLLLNVAEPAEEWITSAQSLGLAARASRPGAMVWDRGSAPAGTSPGGRASGRPQPPRRASGRGLNGTARRESEL